MGLIVFGICFLASAIGAICGIGGGVVIKPMLDSIGILSVPAISFLSGCTVLAMTTYSLVRNRISGETLVEKGTSFPLAIGAAFGGIIGKQLFSMILAMSERTELVGAVQAVCLLAVTVGTLLYTIGKEKIVTRRLNSATICVVLGLLLGAMSAFLGIGGGPINLVVLYYCFSMSTKAAAENSLYIIFFSQIASLVYSVATGSVPEFSIPFFLWMVAGGIGGGIAGRAWNRRLNEHMVERLFVALLIVIIGINVYNIGKFI